MELFTELYDADEELYQESLKNSFLVKENGQWHKQGKNCEACYGEYPVKCKCGGGLIHAEKENNKIDYACDKCDKDFKER